MQAAQTGRFSIASAAWHFLGVAGGGVLAGVVVAAAIGWLNRMLVRRAGEDPSVQILISLLIPFGAYLAGEAAHVSGILAAAVAGMAAHYAELSGPTTAATRTQRTAVWNTVQAALSGVIFILLGEHLRPVVSGLPDAVAGAAAGHPMHLLWYAAALTTAMTGLRFLWVWISMRLTVLRRAPRAEVQRLPQLRMVLVAATAGVRGAVTLAGVLTLPLLASSGAPFPARDTAISLAVGVILLSLLLASLALPPLARGLENFPAATAHDTEDVARVAAARAALRRIQQEARAADGEPATAARAAAAARLTDVYQRRIDFGGRGEDAEEAGREAAAARELRLLALAAERDELYRLRRTGGLDDDVHRRLVRELDLLETSLLST